MKKVNKEITFIYMDSAEYSIYQPIAEEARDRGYQIVFTKNKFQRCEIGFYCQHVNFPQFSKLSIVMLHDIIQQYSNWPDLWYREPWNKYDIGILPSVQWENNWIQCSQWYYSNPRMGVYKIGWPKADMISKIKISTTKSDLLNQYGINPNKPTILYAPSWENDGKQDDFVQSMLKLDVNIVIKQYDASEDLYPEQCKNIREMYEKHKDIERVIILPQKMNIFEAISISDILVSDESSTMCEAIMMGVPAVSVSDWLIPDTKPSRYPKCDYDFVYKTTKDNLSSFIGEILRNYSVYKKEVGQFSNITFSNIGTTSSMIMDIIDDVIGHKKIRYEALKPSKRHKIPLRKYLRFKWIQFKRSLAYNYKERFLIAYVLWCILSWTKRKVFRINSIND